MLISIDLIFAQGGLPLFLLSPISHARLVVSLHVL
jgi:hypothetical protein